MPNLLQKVENSPQNWGPPSDRIDLGQPSTINQDCSVLVIEVVDVELGAANMG